MAARAKFNDSDGAPDVSTESSTRNVSSQSFDVSSESGVDSAIKSEVVNRGFLDLPFHILIMILSSVSIPVKHRVRASRTCKAFYDALSGPHAFLDVKELPGPEIQLKQLRQIIDSDADTNMRSAMAKRLRSSVTILNMYRLPFYPRYTKSFGNQLVFALNFQNLDELSITVGSTKPELSISDVKPNLSGLQFPQHKLQISKLDVEIQTTGWLKVLLNGLARILDFGAVRDLQVTLGQNLGLDLTILLKHEVNNLEKLSLRVMSPTYTNCDSEILSNLLLKNVKSLKHVELNMGHPVQVQGDPNLLLSALCQLQLQYLEFCIGLLPDRWLTNLAANVGYNTLREFEFRPETDHTLDLIPQRLFKKLTYLCLRDVPQSLTSVIAFIEGRPAGLPKIHLKCAVERQEHETDEQVERLETLIKSEINKFDFQFTFLAF